MIYEDEYSDDVYIDDDDEEEENKEFYKDGEEYIDDFIDQENRDYNRQDMSEFDKMDNGYIIAEKSETSPEQSPQSA